MAKVKNLLALLAYGNALLGFVPLWPYLEPLSRILFLLGLGGGIITDRSRRALPAWMVTAASVLLFCLYAVRVNRGNLVDPAVNLLVVLLAVRLGSRKTPRDLLQIFALALLSLAASSLYSLEAIFIVYLIAQFILIAVALVLLTFYLAEEPIHLSDTILRKILSFAILIPMVALPLIAFFFVILPRTQFPLWNTLIGAKAGTSGYTEKVEPGKSATVVAGKRVVFRAAAPPLAKNDLYWRGTVLNTFSGNAWLRGSLPVDEISAPGKGKTVQQTISPEPGGVFCIFTLNVPQQLIGARHYSAGDLVYFRRAPTGVRYRYDVFSVLHAPIVAKNGIDRAYYLRLPGNFSPRLRLLGKELAKVSDEQGKLAHLEELMRGLAITYATTDLPRGDDPLDEFLFVKKRGHCEFFASASALLLRMAGIPTRLVGGYHGGDYNVYGGYYLVTEEMAHVWVEAYLSGVGWISVDPTRWANNYIETETTQEGRAVRILFSYLDLVGYYWNQTIINYDMERQIQMLNQAGGVMRDINWPVRIPRILVVIILVVVVIPVVFRRRSSWSGISLEELLLFLFRRRLKRVHSCTVGQTAGLHELAARLGDPRVTEFVDIYCGALYRDRRLTLRDFRRLYAIIASIGTV